MPGDNRNSGRNSSGRSDSRRGPAAGRTDGPERPRGTRGGTGRERANHDGSHDDSGRDKGPIGIDRAVTRPGAPIRRGPGQPELAPKDKITEPDLATDAPIDVPKKLRREIERVAGDDRTAKRLLQHLTAALTGLDHRDGRTGLPHMRYLKARLPRTGVLREALGVCLYLEENYKEALSELAAYRRLTGMQDQNHLVADALRAVGQGTDRIPELITEMEAEDQEVPDSARYEGRIVWASWTADNGDLGAARAILTPLLDERLEDGPEEHHLRAWYVAADLAERANDPDTARNLFAKISEHAEDFFDTDDRLDSLATLL